jgi:hypothetical protein
LAAVDERDLVLEATDRGLDLVRGNRVDPWTRTAAGSNSPLSVGSEKSRDTRGMRRMLNALSGRPIEVVVMKWPVAARKNGSIGQVIGVPSAARVENSQVRNSRNTASTSAGIGRATLASCRQRIAWDRRR